MAGMIYSQRGVCRYVYRVVMHAYIHVLMHIHTYVLGERREGGGRERVRASNMETNRGIEGGLVKRFGTTLNAWPGMYLLFDTLRC